jgi:hypothetical protein
MFHIEFCLSSSHEVHEFDLGDIEVMIDSKVISSKNRIPDQSMMIFLSASNLLDGLVDLCLNKKRKQFEFTGIDSSFLLIFRRSERRKNKGIKNKGRKNENDEIEIYYQGEKIGKVDAVEILKTTFKAVNNFYTKYGERLLGSGAVRLDLKDSIESALKLMSLGKRA